MSAPTDPLAAAAERAPKLRTRVREATRDDIPTIIRFIKDLATYEKEPDAAKATPELMLENVFEKKYGNAIIAEDPDDADRAIGFALYFFSFSTWTCKPSLYLEDLYVEPSKRNRGAGKALFRQLGHVARERDCARVDWSVLTWNEPSIRFYVDVLGADKMEQWRICRLEGDGIQRLLTL